MTSILITGSQGFLGRNISRVFLGSSFNVFYTCRQKRTGYYQCDLLDLAELKSLISYLNPDLIINCAAFVPQDDISYSDKFKSQKSVDMVRNLLTSSSCPIFHI